MAGTVRLMPDAGSGDALGLDDRGAGGSGQAGDRDGGNARPGSWCDDHGHAEDASLCDRPGTYSSWVAGYVGTTASLSITLSGIRSDRIVWYFSSAIQDSGSVQTYCGTCTVASGVIVSANIQQTSW